MKKNIIYLVILALFMVTASYGQTQTFEEKAKALSVQIDKIVVKEKDALKTTIRTIESRYNDDEISYEDANALKEAATAKTAQNIKDQVAVVENQLHDLVQHRLDTDIAEQDSITKSTNFILSIDKEGFKIKKSHKKKNKRTYSYTVLAFGFNNLIKDGALQDDTFKFANSGFFEYGHNYKTRVFKNSGLLYLNYGLSLRYNRLVPKDNKYFVANTSNTSLQTYPTELRKATFKNVQLVAPVYFEFDLSKPKIEEDKTIYRRNRGLRFGLGGFAGVNFKSKQVLKYKLDGKRIRDKSKGDYNVNALVYGLQAQIGYRDVSFYAKYDMNDLFKNDFVGQKNISFGLKFDL
jgi:hypothetical protein